MLRRSKILLDVLFGDIHYGQVVQLPIKSPILKSEGEDVLVDVPSSADILGDKLSAFAPHTTGVPFFKGQKNCSLEVIKQMFDVSCLFDVVTDFSQTIETFTKFSTVKLGYRDMQDLSVMDILKDTINTALCLSLRPCCFRRPPRRTLSPHRTHRRGLSAIPCRLSYTSAAHPRLA